MTYTMQDTVFTELIEQLGGDDADRFARVLELLMNVAMLVEQREHLRADPYERSDSRNGHANGYKDRSLSTRLGQLKLRVPQVRGAEEPFFPKTLEKGQRSERALKIAIAQMYVQGVSTRRVAAITEELCGLNISSTQVSRAAAELDAIMEPWRTRRLGETPYLIVDARYEKVRQDGAVLDAAVLVAVGVGPDGKRSILGCSVAVSEHEVHWRTFLQSLVARGLCGVQMISSDDHSGLGAARKAVFGGVAWQRCQFHLQQNAQAHVRKQEMKAPVAADIRAIFQAPDRERAESLLKEAVERYRVTAPTLSKWMDENLTEGLTVFALPEPHRRFLRTSNGVERINKEIRRRTRVAGIFPNEASCLRLVTAVLMEISDDWEAGKAYLTFLPSKE